MPIRTYRFLGTAMSTADPVSVRFSFNEVELFNGTVPTTIVNELPLTIDDPLPTLFEFSASTDIFGTLPIEIAVDNGCVFFGQFTANYVRRTIISENPLVLGDGWDVDFDRINKQTVESDGLTNVTLNGSPWLSRNLTEWPDRLGPWTYRIPPYCVLTGDIDVDFSMIITR
jgi:hypothetical protein